MGRDNLFYYIQNALYKVKNIHMCPHTRVSNIGKSCPYLSTVPDGVNDERKRN